MNLKLRIYLGDLAYRNDLARGDISIPLNISYLSSYARAKFGSDISIQLFKDPLKLMEKAHESPPDILGLSNFYWNRNINIYVAQKIKTIHPNCIIIIGGVSIDTDPDVQKEIYESYAGACDFMVPDEGEIGFCNVVNKFLSSDSAHLRRSTIEGAVFFEGGVPISAPCALPELKAIPSPILSGILDEFLNEKYLPILQFSRGCPYQCTFCVSGKTKNRIRFFDLEIVKEELRYVAKRYREHSYIPLMIIDENFGINEHDLEVAKFVVAIYEETGYPKRLDTYLNKTFNDRTRAIAKIYSRIPEFEYLLPFQSFTEETLKATKRKNIPLGQLRDILKWAKQEGLRVTSEFICGLPKDTLLGVLHCIDQCMELGVNFGMNPLMMFPGNELYRKEQKELYPAVTKFRPTYTPSVINIDGHFISEYEEIVVSNDTFTYDDFLQSRKILFMVYAMSHLRFFTKVLQFLISKGIKASEIIVKMVHKKDPDCIETQRYFLNDLEDAFTSELYDTKEEFFEAMKKNATKAEIILAPQQR